MKILIPYFIQENYKKGIYKGEFTAFTMFLDISGFTLMTEKLLKEGKEGVEVLSTILNNIFQPVLDAVYERNGFVSGFAGDAFTAIFQTGNYLVPLFAALSIKKIFQENKIQKTVFGDFELFLKLGLSHGNIRWGIIGSTKHKTFYFKGEAIDGCANSEQKCKRMQIVLDNTFANLIDSSVTIRRLQNLESNDTYFILEGIELADECVTIKSSGITNRRMTLSREVLSKFLPDNVLDYKQQGEFRNVVSVFISFKELDNFTELQQFISAVLENTNEFGGYFSSLAFGDKGPHVVIFFGVPVSFENNIWRAINFIKSLKDKFSNNIRVGITTGIVYSGIVGSTRRCAYTCLGNIVNQSAKFMLGADWNQVWVSEEVKKNEYTYELKELGGKEFKGFSKPIPIFELLWHQEKVKPKFFKGLMVGRQTEYKRLTKYIETILNNKFGGIVYIYGEAGIGKSKLVTEVTNDLTEKFQTLLLQSDSVLKKSMNPFVYMFTNYFKQYGLTTEEDKKAKFEIIFYNLISELNILSNTSESSYHLDEIPLMIKELTRIKSILGALVGIYWEDSLYEHMDARGRFENVFYAIIEFFKALSLIKPLIIYLEDLHWVDNDSKKVFVALTRKIKDFSIILIATSRFNDDSSKPILEIDKENLQNEIVLDILTYDSISEFFENQIGQKANDELIEFINSKAQGNPFYIEQFILYLKENHLIELTDDSKDKEYFYRIIKREIDIPVNINSVLIARIDRLTNDLKETAQVASILGREFDIQILLELISVINAKIAKNELDKLIYQGENERLWQPLSEIKYIFKHALLREAIYEMQLKQRLRYLHKLAGEVMEELYRDNEKLYQDFAYHFKKSGVIHKTKMYLEKSADYLNRNFKNEEAISAYDQLLTLTSASEKKIEIYYKKAEIFEVIARWNDCVEILKTGIQLAMETSNMKKEIKLKIKLGRVLERKDDYNEGLLVLESVKEYLETGENLSSLENQGFYSTCLDFIGIILYRQGHFDDALNHYMKSLSIATKVGDKRRISYSLNGIGGILFNQGNYNAGLEAYQKSLKIKEELGDKIGIGISLNNIGLVHYCLGNYNEGLKFENKSLELYREVGAKDYMGYNYAYISWAYTKIEEFKLALSTALLHLKNIVEIGTYAEKGRTHLAIALVLIRQSQLDEESKVILDEITEVTNLKLIPETYFEYAIKISSEDNYLETLVPTLYEYGKYLCETGRKDKGCEKLKLAKIKAAEGGMKGELKKLKELENLC